MVGEGFVSSSRYLPLKQQVTERMVCYHGRVNSDNCLNIILLYLISLIVE